MTEQQATRSVPLGAWLSGLSDERLVGLLGLRPDLAQPAPGSIAALAARAASRQSIKAAADELDFLRLAVMDGLLVLGADHAAVPVDVLKRLIGERASDTDLNDALDDLRARALTWGEEELRVSAEAGAALPWYPGQAVTDSDAADELGQALDGLDDAAREVLERLVAGPPVGRTRDAAAGAPADRPVQRLLAAGLLRQVDAETVLLPRVVGQILRGEQPGPIGLAAPDPVVSTTSAADVDASAAGAVMELIRQVEVVLETLSAAPVPELRSGGLGVREAKRLAKITGIGEQRLGLILELAAAAGLIASGVPGVPAPDAATFWAPTVAADRFAEAPAESRWLQLAVAWLELPSRPGLIGDRGPDGKTYGALSDSLYSTAAPMDRALLLSLLAGLPRGAGVDAVSASRALVWRRPRWAARLQPVPVGHLLDEAHAVGLTGRNALSTPARALLGGGGGDSALAAMAAALPAPVDHFLVQADLTVVVPGPLLREIADELGAVATVESAGAAMVYRVGEQSVRHALDTGRTADGLQRFFERYSKTPVPQGLSYLINDVARRHGRLRVGIAASFIRCDDPVLLSHAVAAPALAGLEVRLLAPTVAVSQAPIAEVLAGLRRDGFAPAAEDSSGAVVDLRRRDARVPANPVRRSPRPPSRPSAESLSTVVSMLRRVDSSPLTGMRMDPAVAIALLRQAAVHGTDVLIGYVDAAGVATQRMVRPLAVRGGQLMAWDPTQGRPREFAVHRVTSVMSAESG